MSWMMRSSHRTHEITTRCRLALPTVLLHLDSVDVGSLDAGSVWHVFSMLLLLRFPLE